MVLPLHSAQRLDSWESAQIIAGFGHIGSLPPGIDYARLIRHVRAHGGNIHPMPCAKVLESMCKLPYAVPDSFRPTQYVVT